jgi:hypothetical protein
MSAAVLLEIQVRGIKWAIIIINLMKTGIQTNKRMPSSEITKTEA